MSELGIFGRSINSSSNLPFKQKSNASVSNVSVRCSQIWHVIFSLSCLLVGKLSIQPLSRLLVRETFMTATAEARARGETHPFHFPIPDTFVRQLSSSSSLSFVRFSARETRSWERISTLASSEMDLSWYSAAQDGEWKSETIPNRNRRLRTVIPYSCLSTFRSALGSFLELMPFLSWELFACQSLSRYSFLLTTVQCFLLSLEIPFPSGADIGVIRLFFFLLSIGGFFPLFSF